MVHYFFPVGRQFIVLGWFIPFPKRTKISSFYKDMNLKEKT